MLLDVDIEWLFYLEDLMTYKEIFTFQNLYLAHKKARKSKRHKKDVILFEIDLDWQHFLIQILYRELFILNWS